MFYCYQCIENEKKEVYVMDNVGISDVCLITFESMLGKIKSWVNAHRVLSLTNQSPDQRKKTLHM